MKTLVSLFEHCVEKYSDNPYIHEKTGDNWGATSYKELHSLVCDFAAGLIAAGVKKGDRIVLLSEGRRSWIIAELGILFAGAVNVPVSVKIDEPDEILFRIKHSESSFIITSLNQLRKIRIHKDGLPEVKKVIIMDETDLLDDEVLLSEIIEKGKKFLENHKDLFIKTKDSVTESDYANICYTSGTTADPKGIILTHRNYTANVEQANSLMSIPEHYRTLLILPWDHSFGHTAGLYSFMLNGASVACIQTGKNPNETLRNIPINIKEIKPHIILSVPALAKNFRKNIEKAIRDKGKITESLFRFALKVAYAYNQNGFDKGKGFQFFNRILYSIFDKIIFKKVRAGFGGEMQFFIGGGALLDVELQKFFYAIGIPMYQGYGLSEASPIISSNAPKKHKFGSSGFLVENLSLKICDEQGIELPLGEKGEIVVKGENVMAGYWKNDTATKEVLKNGWLHTGDLGFVDHDGFLYVLGRFKSLLIASDGEKYSPEGIEETLVESSRFIDQCMFYNNQSPYTIALLVPNYGPVIHELKKTGLTTESEEGQKVALKILQEELDQFKPGGKFGGKFPVRWFPGAVLILDEPFTEQNRLLNSTLKMVRGKITEKYSDQINFLFTPEGKIFYNKYNMNAVKNKIS